MQVHRFKEALFQLSLNKVEDLPIKKFPMQYSMILLVNHGLELST